MGDSSGGWTATMAGVTGAGVQAVVDLYGPTDFLQMHEHMIDCPFLNAIFGLTECHNDSLSPESRLVGCPNYVGRGEPPFLPVQWDTLVASMREHLGQRRW